VQPSAASAISYQEVATSFFLFAPRQMQRDTRRNFKVTNT